MDSGSGNRRVQAIIHFYFYSVATHVGNGTPVTISDINYFVQTLVYELGRPESAEIQDFASQTYKEIVAK